MAHPCGAGSCICMDAAEVSDHAICLAGGCVRCSGGDCGAAGLAFVPPETASAQPPAGGYLLQLPAGRDPGRRVMDAAAYREECK